MSRIRSLGLVLVLVSASVVSVPAAVAQGPSPSTGASPSAAGALPLPPDGTWESRLTIEELRAAGATDIWTQDGVFRWTFGNGQGRIQVTWADGSTEACAGPLEAIAVDVVRVHQDCGADDIGWSLDEAGLLHLRLVATSGPVEVNRAYLEAKPWLRVDVPGASAAPGSPAP